MWVLIRVEKLNNKDMKRVIVVVSVCFNGLTATEVPRPPYVPVCVALAKKRSCEFFLLQVSDTFHAEQHTAHTMSKHGDHNTGSEMKC